MLSYWNVDNILFSRTFICCLLLLYIIDLCLVVGIYGKCMTQIKIMNPTTIHTGKVWGMSQRFKFKFIQGRLNIVIKL
jgi:hypothetical protein